LIQATVTRGSKIGLKKRKQGQEAEGEEKARYPRPCKSALVNIIPKKLCQSYAFLADPATEFSKPPLYRGSFAVESTISS